MRSCRDGINLIGMSALPYIHPYVKGIELPITMFMGKALKCKKKKKKKKKKKNNCSS